MNIKQKYSKFIQWFFIFFGLLSFTLCVILSIINLDIIYLFEGTFAFFIFFLFGIFSFNMYQKKNNFFPKFIKVFKIFYIIDSVFMLIVFTILAFKNKQYSLVIAYPILVVGYLIIILFEKQKSKK
ncbi:hypothetical protein ACAG39_06380 [Caldicellulosiruptoraceae bacterium PP1]